MMKVLMVIALILFIAGGAALAAVTIVTENHTVTIPGTVLEYGLVKEGQTVREGEVLVNVQKIVGITPTSRAKFDGRVIKVLVRPGDQVETHQVVVILAHK